jgi:hypothetical protein
MTRSQSIWRMNQLAQAVYARAGMDPERSARLAVGLVETYMAAPLVDFRRMIERTYGFTMRFRAKRKVKSPRPNVAAFARELEAA